MSARDFSFAEHARHFDEHIAASIPGLADLHGQCVALSAAFVENGTKVVDIGCSTGSLLRRIRSENDGRRRQAVEYIGVDVEANYREHWERAAATTLRFHEADVRRWGGFKRVSLGICNFTLSFLPEQDRTPLLRRIHDGLIEGGALIVADKMLLENAKFQDIFTTVHYDFKLRAFSPAEVLAKRRSLSGQMRPWTEQRLIEALCDAGFQRSSIQHFWRQLMFGGFIAVKGAPSFRFGRIEPE